MTLKNVGIFCIVAGSVCFSSVFLLSIPGGELLSILLCIAFLSVFNLGFALIAISKPLTIRKRYAMIYLIIGAALLATSSIFAYFSLTGTSLSLIEAIFLICFAYMPLLIKNRYEKWTSYTTNRSLLLLLCLGDLTSGISLLLGSLSKFLYWPGASLLIIFGGIAIIATAIGWNQVFKYSVRKRKEAEDKANHALNEIKDSINYAWRIQQAKLPMLEDIQRNLPLSFVLFKPKDIVSGDFYYYHQKAGLAFIAAADCTGHGVPGALMSMIASEKLDEALAVSSDTSSILSHVNQRVKQSLRQSDSDESTRDGMDIALCSFEPAGKILNYAGANRPLWLIKNGETEIEEIKATKKAIGGFTAENQLFESHELQLHSGDTFYLFSDGYADTFGGKDGKKVTTKRMRELLLSIQQLPMAEQCQSLDQFIENWKNGDEQVDDILVIGVRIP